MIKTAAMTPITCQNGTAVALGYFDGVHIGHRAVMQAALDAAKVNGLQSAVFTFTLPPENYKGRAVLSQNEKEQRIASLGIDFLFCPPSAAFFALSCEAFVNDVLLGCMHAKTVFCGDDFTFGANAAGDVTLLRTLCAAKGVSVHTVPTVLFEGEPVSSTRIRRALEEGDMPLVNALLGQRYSVDFEVQAGHQLGRTLGLPTINQKFPAYMILPKYGVYITETTLDGVAYASATGLGTRPTVGGENVTCETFILDFEGDLYGKHPVVSFYEYLKPSRKCADMEELRRYIDDAAASSAAYFAKLK